MRRASHLALALLLAVSTGPLDALPAAASAGAGRAAPAPSPDREAKAKGKVKLSAEGRYIVTLKPGKSVEAAKGRAAKHGITADKTFRNALKGFSAKLDPEQLAAVRADPDVDLVVPDEIISMTAQTRPTGIKRVGAPESAIARINGSDGDIASGERVDADVAIVDTGIDASHPDLNVVGGISCSTQNPNAWGVDPNGHGTHVAGTVGALDNSIGVVGVAPGVRLWAVRILDSSGNGLLSWYVCGLDWITAQRDPLDPTRPLIEAANMSVAKSGSDDNNCGNTNGDVMHRAICRVVASGVTVVAAAGNNSFNAAKLRPASYNEVVTVSALADSDGRPGGDGGSLCYSWGGYDRDDTFADFSNYGGDVDLIAPGDCILSTLPGNRYGYISGTSMAAPHVTAAAAMWKASRPTATPAQVRLALRAAGSLDWNTATDPDSVHEPLLDVSHILALGDWALDATPGTSHDAIVGAAGGTVTVPVAVVRAEDFAGEVDLSIVGDAPFGADIEPSSLTGLDGTAAGLSFTVPPGTPSGSFDVTIRATDGIRERTSVFPIRVDAVAPTATAPAIRLRTGSTLGAVSVAAIGTWGAGNDPGGSIAGYQLRWRIDGTLQGAFTVGGSSNRQATRSMTVNHAYSLRVRVRDEAGNWSGWAESNAFRPALRQDTSSTLIRHGGWTRERHSFFSGGTALSSVNKGASLTLRFNGRAFGLVVSRGPGRGKANVYVDGSLAGTINTYRSTADNRYLAFARSWATNGPHTVRVVVLATPRHRRITVDTFVIVR